MDRLLVVFPFPGWRKITASFDCRVDGDANRRDLRARDGTSAVMMPAGLAYFDDAFFRNLFDDAHALLAVRRAGCPELCPALRLTASHSRFIDAHIGERGRRPLLPPPSDRPAESIDVPVVATVRYRVARTLHERAQIALLLGVIARGPLTATAMVLLTPLTDAGGDTIVGHGNRRSASVSRVLQGFGAPGYDLADDEQSFPTTTESQVHEWRPARHRC